MRSDLGSRTISWEWGSGTRSGLETLHHCSTKVILNIRMFWGLIATFVEVTVEELVGWAFLGPHVLSKVKGIQSFEIFEYLKNVIGLRGLILL